MSAAPFAAKRFLLSVDGDLLNVDYIVRLHISAGKLMADMASGPDVEIEASDALMADLRWLLPMNRRG